MTDQPTSKVTEAEVQQVIALLSGKPIEKKCAQFPNKTYIWIPRVNINSISSSIGGVSVVHHCSFSGYDNCYQCIRDRAYYYG